MKFVILACLIAAASAVPLATYLAAPAAVTYHTQSQSLVPVGTNVFTTVSHGPAIVKSTPLAVAAPIISAPYAAPLAAPYGIGIYGGAPLGYSKSILSSPAILAGPGLLH